MFFVIGCVVVEVVFVYLEVVTMVCTSKSLLKPLHLCLSVVLLDGAASGLRLRF